MNRSARTLAGFALLWLVLAAAGAVWIARQALEQRREAFETDARIAHRLLSQRAVQQEAILATLALLQPGAIAAEAAPEQRLPSLYPQVLRVLRRNEGQDWPTGEAASLQAGEAASRTQGRVALASADFASGQFTVVQAALPASFALQIDLRAFVPRAEWPFPADGAAQVALEHAGQTHVLAPGRGAGASGWDFGFRKHLAADSQPFDVVASLHVGWGELPWGPIAAWVLATGGALALARSALRQRAERRRAQELLRLGQVGRLNALGELAAGMAHELNQPLTAVLANAQAAQRLLAEEPPELDAVRGAIDQAAKQARRASDVVGRLRRTVERPQLGAHLKPVRLDEVARQALDLLEPDCRRLGVVPALTVDAAARTVMAEPVALEQIMHNLLTNALHALGQVPAGERRLEIRVVAEAQRGVLSVRDSGPGIAPEALPRLFEPFFSTRDGGLGLGLSLCETLAAGMGGTLTGGNAAPRGAEFRLVLPLRAEAA